MIISALVKRISFDVAFVGAGKRGQLDYITLTARGREKRRSQIERCNGCHFFLLANDLAEKRKLREFWRPRPRLKASLSFQLIISQD